MGVIEKTLLHGVRIKATCDFCDAQIVIEHSDAGLENEEAARKVIAWRIWIVVLTSFQIRLRREDVRFWDSAFVLNC